MDDTNHSEESLIAGLQSRFLQAMAARERGDVDGAAELLRGILRIEPRLPEPRMELANILLGASQLTEAEEHLREAIQSLETGGQWSEELPENVVLSLAYGTLAEVLRRQADSDEIVFGDPAGFEKRIREAKSAFKKAAALDPDNVHAGYWSFDPRRRGIVAEE
ncbi:MAG: tetratricopeptide (TPR) repeat protein [Myxococcota bacterium]|jgi:tetratricopeptide (TPR) repeat protein